MVVPPPDPGSDELRRRDPAQAALGREPVRDVREALGRDVRRRHGHRPRVAARVARRAAAARCRRAGSGRCSPRRRCTPCCRSSSTSEPRRSARARRRAVSSTTTCSASSCACACRSCSARRRSPLCSACWQSAARCCDGAVRRRARALRRLQRLGALRRRRRRPWATYMFVRSALLAAVATGCVIARRELPGATRGAARMRRPRRVMVIFGQRPLAELRLALWRRGAARGAPCWRSARRR